MRDPRDRTDTARLPTITRKAHYDGRRILLDEPFDLPAGARLKVMALPPMSEVEDPPGAEAAAAGRARTYPDHDPWHSSADI